MNIKKDDDILKLWHNSNTYNTLKYKLMTGEIYMARTALSESLTNEQRILLEEYTQKAGKAYFSSLDAAFDDGFCKGICIAARGFLKNE